MITLNINEISISTDSTDMAGLVYFKHFLKLAQLFYFHNVRES